MTKETKQDAANALVKSNENQETLSVQNYKETAAAFINDFSQVDVNSLQGLTQEYLQLKPDTTYNMVFTAMSKFKGSNGGEVDAVVLVDEKNQSWINGNTVLVNSLKKVTMFPCLVRIVTGKLINSAHGGGKYLDMDVYALPKAANQKQ